MPRAARRAADTPQRAAWPAWNGLVIVPKLRRLPDASETAMASAWAVRSESRRSTLAAAAAAPRVPSVDVACHPAR